MENDEGRVDETGGEDGQNILNLIHSIYFPVYSSSIFICPKHTFGVRGPIFDHLVFRCNCKRRSHVTQDNPRLHYLEQPDDLDLPLSCDFKENILFINNNSLMKTNIIWSSL
jgi:hypothetical protein